MKFYLTILTALLLLLSCRKEKPQGEDIEIIGKYEWSWTSLSSTNQSSGYTSVSYVYASGSQDKYGIEITGNGKIFLYKNGRFTDDFRIISISRHQNGSKKIDCSENKSFTYYSNEIQSRNFPSLYPDEDVNYINYFIKK